MYPIYKWADISANYSGSTIILGNGASISVDRRFSYSSLINHAMNNNLITDDIVQLFRFFNTDDFELVLRLVWQASNVNRSLGILDIDNLAYNAYIQVRDCLIQSVRGIHPEYNDVCLQLPKIYNFLKQFKTVLSLNYDLILYWTMMYCCDNNHSFKDCFIRGFFDDNWQKFRQPYNTPQSTLVFYPHGSLILGRDVVNTEYKINNISADYTLLDSILQNWTRNNAVPLFVSEGTSQQKIKTIQSSYYLSTVYWEVLPSLSSNFVVYGWGFGDHDVHILKALKANHIPKIAVSVYGNNQAYCQQVSYTISNILGYHVQIEFFDSESPECWNND